MNNLGYVSWIIYFPPSNHNANLNGSMINDLRILLSEEDYETDCICDDINSDPESNIFNQTSGHQKDSDVLISNLNKFVCIETSHKTLIVLVIDIFTGNITKISRKNRTFYM